MAGAECGMWRVAGAECGVWQGPSVAGAECGGAECGGGPMWQPSHDGERPARASPNVQQ